MEKKISDLFDYGQAPALPLAAPALDAGEIESAALQKLRAAKRARPRRLIRQTARAILIAAVIGTLLTVTALGAGLSIHRLRLMQLREQMAITENHVESYREYEPPEDKSGLTLLATVNDGIWLRLFVNLSPVAPDETVLYESVHREDGSAWVRYYAIAVNGAATNIAVPFSSFESAFLYGREEELPPVYDSETQTLTLECRVFREHLPDDGPLTLTAQRIEVPAENWRFPPETILIHDFGSLDFAPAETQVRELLFSRPVPFTNRASGLEGQFAGVKLMPTSLTWLYTYPGVEKTFTRQLYSSEEDARTFWAMHGAWADSADTAARSAVLHFADGSALMFPVSIYFTGQDGDYASLTYVWFDGSIDIDAVTAVEWEGQLIKF